MIVRSIPATTLTDRQISHWAELQASDPTTDSPFFHPAYTQSVAAVRPDVEVAVLESGGTAIGYFPFQRTRWNIGRPVGGRMSDFHGFVGHTGSKLNPEQLVRDCKLRVWDFDHLPVSQEPFRPHHWRTVDSPYLDLSEGFEAYKRASASNALPQIMRKSRKLQREVGELRLVASSADPPVFETLLRWKTEQYRARKTLDVFALGWTVTLLRRILATRHGDFSGMMSALYAGEQLAAVHLGMRCRHVLHCWFPAYNVTLQKYSPGLVLWLMLAQSAETLGIRRVDFGKGDGQYKDSLSTGSTQVAEGFVSCSSLATLMRHGSHQIRDWVRKSPLRSSGSLLRRAYRRLTF